MTLGDGGNSSGTALGLEVGFSIVPRVNGRLDWYITLAVPAGSRFVDPKSFLRHRFHLWLPKHASDLPAALAQYGARCRPCS